MEILYTYTEPDGSHKLLWCKGEVVGVGKNNMVDIEWDKKYLRDHVPHAVSSKAKITEIVLQQGKWY